MKSAYEVLKAQLLDKDSKLEAVDLSQINLSNIELLNILNAVQLSHSARFLLMNANQVKIAKEYLKKVMEANHNIIVLNIVNGLPDEVRLSMDWVHIQNFLNRNIMELYYGQKSLRASMDQMALQLRALERENTALKEGGKRDAPSLTSASLFNTMPPPPAPSAPPIKGAPPPPPPPSSPSMKAPPTPPPPPRSPLVIASPSSSPSLSPASLVERRAATATRGKSKAGSDIDALYEIFSARDLSLVEVMGRKSAFLTLATVDKYTMPISHEVILEWLKKGAESLLAHKVKLETTIESLSKRYQSSPSNDLTHKIQNYSEILKLLNQLEDYKSCTKLQTEIAKERVKLNNLLEEYQSIKGNPKGKGTSASDWSDEDEKEDLVIDEKRLQSHIENYLKLEALMGAYIATIKPPEITIVVPKSPRKLPELPTASTSIPLHPVPTVPETKQNPLEIYPFNKLIQDIFAGMKKVSQASSASWLKKAKWEISDELNILEKMIRLSDKDFEKLGRFLDSEIERERRSASAERDKRIDFLIAIQTDYKKISTSVGCDELLIELTKARDDIKEEPKMPTEMRDYKEFLSKIIDELTTVKQSKYALSSNHKL